MYLSSCTCDVFNAWSVWKNVCFHFCVWILFCLECLKERLFPFLCLDFVLPGVFERTFVSISVFGFCFAWSVWKNVCFHFCVWILFCLECLKERLFPFLCLDFVLPGVFERMFVSIYVFASCFDYINYPVHVIILGIWILLLLFHTALVTPCFRCIDLTLRCISLLF